MKEESLIIDGIKFTARKVARKKCLNDKLWENKVKDQLKLTGLILRFDHKDHNPDWLYVSYGEAIGIECKHYTSYKCPFKAIVGWINRQPKQFQRFKDLLEDIKINIYFYLQDKTYCVTMK